MSLGLNLACNSCWILFLKMVMKVCPVLVLCWFSLLDEDVFDFPDEPDVQEVSQQSELAVDSVEYQQRFQQICELVGDYLSDSD